MLEASRFKIPSSKRFVMSQIVLVDQRNFHSFSAEMLKRPQGPVYCQRVQGAPFCCRVQSFFIVARQQYCKCHTNLPSGLLFPVQIMVTIVGNLIYCIWFFQTCRSNQGPFFSVKFYLFFSSNCKLCHHCVSAPGHFSTVDAHSASKMQSGYSA